MTIINSYTNGNLHVDLYEDGKKVRKWTGDPNPEHPESIDLKITDYCDAGCAYCHEGSTKRGNHASIDDIDRITSGIPEGVEIAIGGGNPMSHPDLYSILTVFRDRGLIANITVNAIHIAQEGDRLTSLQEEGLVYGIGVSGADHFYIHAINDMIPEKNVVVHAIVGVDDPFDAMRSLTVCPRLLVLGYKQFGRGIKFYDENI